MNFYIEVIILIYLLGDECFKEEKYDLAIQFY